MLKQRSTAPEMMDSPEFGYQEVVDTFRFLQPVNRRFGGHRPVLSFFGRESRNWERHRIYRVLDVGCGAGDVAVTLVRWGRSRGYRLEIRGIDKHPAIVELAGTKCQAYPEISLACQDVFAFGDEQYDYVHASQFLHHFADDRVPGVLNHLLDISRCKVVINDLVRTPLFYLATWFFTLLTSAVFRHDARLSVKKGFKLDELERILRDNAFHHFRLEKHFLYRFLLILSKSARCT